MIINLLLGVLQVVVNTLLAPLTVINFVVDIVSSISVVSEFIKVIAYLFPWSAITPLLTIVIAIFGFRATISLIKTIWDLLPIL